MRVRVFLSLLLMASVLALFGYTGRWGDLPSTTSTWRLKDTDGNGLYEYQLFPYDCDGDGSTWEQCTAAETPDNACAYGASRVWDDFNDDLNCAIDYAEVGGEIEVEDGLYPIRCWTCNGGTEDGESCARDSDCDSNSCTLASDRCSYKYQVTFPNGELRSGASSYTAYVPLTAKSGLYLHAKSKMDWNGYRDGVQSGAWILHDLGSTFGQNDDKISGGGIWSFGVGMPAGSEAGTTAYGEILEVRNTPAHATVQEAFTPGEFRLCVCNTAGCGSDDWVDDNLVDGSMILIYGGDTLSGTSGASQFGQVTTICDSGAAGCQCGTGSGIYVGVKGIGQLTADAAGPPYAYVYEIDERFMMSKITVEGFTWAPQNTFSMPWGGSEQSPIDCGEEYVSGQNDPTTYDNECDITAIIGMFPAVGTRFQYNSFITPASILFGTWDGQDGCVDCVYGPGNYVGLGSGTQFIDTGCGYSIIGNVFDGCQIGQNDAAACITTYGDGVVIEDNIFHGIGRIACKAGDLDGLVEPTSGRCGGSFYALQGTLVHLGQNLDVFRNNVAEGIFGRLVRVTMPDAIVEGNRVVGQTGNETVFVEDGAHRAQIRNNQFFYVQEWQNLAFTTYRYWAPVSIEATATGPFNVSVTGNLARYEPIVSDGSPDPATCFVEIPSWDAGPVATARKMNIQDNILRGFWSPICDDGADPVAEGSWNTTVAVPPIGDWINFLGDERFVWKGSTDAHNARPVCNAAAEGHLYMFWNLDAIDSCADPGDDDGTAAAPCYCDGTDWNVADIWP